ncbi:MAG: helix-turn-helix domain-containing protein [Eubacteriales bacterium]
MKSIRYNGYLGPRLNRKKAKKRIMQVISTELTDHQQRAIRGYYLEGKNIPQLAEEFGVNKSTISRTLARGESRLRRFLKY